MFLIHQTRIFWRYICCGEVIVDLKKKEFKESGTTTKEKLPIKVNMASLKILL